MIKDANTFLKITIGKELYQLLRDRAKQHQTSVSKYALSLIKKALLDEM